MTGSASDDVGDDALRSLSRVAAIAVALLLAACATPAAPSQPGDATIYVIRRDWHTDIGLPVEEITGPLAVLEKSFPGVRFLTFGFGERQFLVNRKTDFAAMVLALLPSRSALLMTALGASPEAAFGRQNVVLLHVSRPDFDRIQAAIHAEIEQTPGGEPVLLDNGPYPGSVYYAARGTYSGLYTCNSWTAATLRAGGLPMAAIGTLFAGQVMEMAVRIRDEQAAPSE